MAGLGTIISVIKNSDKIITAVGALGKIGGKLKGWIFADGKFNASRAVTLIVGGVFTGVGYAYIPEYMPEIYDKLDQLSDMIGYADSIKA